MRYRTGQASGKNDGSVKGVRYFHCKPMYGLFARPETIEVVHPGASNAGAHLRNAHAAAPNAITSSPRVASSTVSGRMRDAIDAPENAVAVVASVFRFNKQTNQWAEVGTGTLKLAFKLDQVTKKDLRISLDGQQRSADGAFVRHHIEPDTALEPNVGSDRAWVFRANDAVQLRGGARAPVRLSICSKALRGPLSEALRDVPHHFRGREGESLPTIRNTAPASCAIDLHVACKLWQRCHDAA